MKTIFNKLQEEYPNIEFSAVSVIDENNIKVYRHLVVNGKITSYRWNSEELQDASFLVNSRLEERITEELMFQIKERGLDEYR